MIRRGIVGSVWIVAALALPVLGVAAIHSVHSDGARLLAALFLLGATGFAPVGIGIGVAALARGGADAGPSIPVDPAAAAAGWDRGIWLLDSLRQGRIPAPLSAPTLIRAPGETVHLDLVATASRYYRADPPTHSRTRLYLGPPTLVATGALLGAIGDAAAASRARRLAGPQWRDHQPARVLATTHRLICTTTERTDSFCYRTVSAFHADLTQWTIILEFHDTAPLRLHGPDAPVMATYLCWALFGTRTLGTHPALAPLRDAI